MTVADCIDAYVKDLKKQGRTLATRNAYARDLARLHAQAKAHGVDRVDALDLTLINLGCDGLGRPSVARYHAAVRGFTRFLRRNRAIQKDPCAELETPAIARRVPKGLAEGPLLRLLDTPAARGFRGLRDRAMMQLMARAGATVTELIKLDQGQLRNANALVLLGKGPKHRAVPLEPATRRALDAYAEVRKGQAAAASSNAVFISSDGEHLTRQGIWKFVAGYALACGVHTSVSPQTLRDTFAIHELEAGVALEKLRESLGHANASTTKVYSDAMDPEKYAEHLRNHPRSVVGNPRP